MRLRGSGRAECLEFAAPLQPLRRSSCMHTAHQLFKPHPEPASTGTGGEGAYTLRYARDPQQCLDWFEAEAEWGLWTCDPGTKPNQLLTATRPAATARTQAQGSAAAGGAATGAASFCLAGAARLRWVRRPPPGGGGPAAAACPRGALPAARWLTEHVSACGGWRGCGAACTTTSRGPACSRAARCHWRRSSGGAGRLWARRHRAAVAVYEASSPHAFITDFLYTH